MSKTVPIAGEGVMGFIHFPSTKVNAVVQLEFKLAYYDAAVQYVHYYAMDTSSALNQFSMLSLLVIKGDLLISRSKNSNSH